MSPTQAPTGLSRRSFIHLVGRAGGAVAAYNTMVALGLMPVPTAYAGPPVLAPGSGRGRHVVVLGAGIAGLVAAYELQKAAFRCTVLEARARPGGRCWTIRGGDAVAETDSLQEAAWPKSDRLYFNPGPARIPQHHSALLGYCRELGVSLQTIVTHNPNAFVQDDESFGGKPVRIGDVEDDVRGQIAELVAKGIDQGELDLPVSVVDREAILALVRDTGDLDGDAYRGPAPAAGFPPFADRRPPLALGELTRSGFRSRASHFAQAFARAPTMLEPLGGMDRIAEAFAARLEPAIKYNTVVTEIRRRSDGVRVFCREGRDGPVTAIDASFAIVTIPLSVLSAIDNDFGSRQKAAISAANYVPAAKVGLHARRRFWEEEASIFGGTSWTTRDATQLWYPSHSFQSDDGILLGAYVWTSDLGTVFAAMTPAERLRSVIADGERLHAGYAADVGRGVAVSWAKIPFSSGAWCEWSAADRRQHVPALQEVDGPFFFAGEHVSDLPGWQEGAVLSAQSVVTQLSRMVQTP